MVHFAETGISANTNEQSGPSDAVDCNSVYLYYAVHVSTLAASTCNACAISKNNLMSHLHVVHKFFDIKCHCRLFNLGDL